MNTITGTLQRLLFSPKGKLEGLLLSEHGQPIQVTLEPEGLDAVAMQKAIGQRLQLEATADHSPKTKDAAHPVYLLRKLTKVGSKVAPTRRSSDGVATIKGRVAAIHYAKHGEPNGVVLETGELIHLRPHGMEQCGLSAGSKVSVQGERRATILGTPLIEAHRVNGHTIK